MAQQPLGRWQRFRNFAGRTTQGARNAYQGARNVYQNFSPAWQRAALVITGAVLLLTLITGVVVGTRAYRFTTNVIQRGYQTTAGYVQSGVNVLKGAANYTSPNIPNPDFWGVCNYVNLAEPSDLRLLNQSLSPVSGRRYVPVELDCRGEDVIAGLEYPVNVDERLQEFKSGRFRQVQLHDSTPWVIHQFGKWYVFSPHGFHRER